MQYENTAQTCGISVWHFSSMHTDPGAKCSHSCVLISHQMQKKLRFIIWQIMDIVSSSDDNFIFILLNKKKKRKFWVHPILERQTEHGAFHRLTQELCLCHPCFRQYFRMLITQFEAILEILGPHLRRTQTNYHELINPEQWLAACLR